MSLVEIFLSFISILVLLIGVLVGVAFLTLLERKVLGYIQLHLFQTVYSSFKRASSSLLIIMRSLFETIAIVVFFSKPSTYLTFLEIAMSVWSVLLILNTGWLLNVELSD